MIAAYWRLQPASAAFVVSAIPWRSDHHLVQNSLSQKTSRDVFQDVAAVVERAALGLCASPNRAAPQPSSSLFDAAGHTVCVYDPAFHTCGRGTLV